MVNAIEIAIKTEKDGIDFYERLSKKTKSSLGKSMFLSFIEDEKRHLKILSKISKEMGFQEFDFKVVGPKKEVKTIFEKIGKDVKEKIEANPGEVEAIEIAMEMENKGFRFYKKEAEKTSDKVLKNVFEKLASEESEHHEILQNTLQYLKDSGHWFLWDEHAPID